MPRDTPLCVSCSRKWIEGVQKLEAKQKSPIYYGVSRWRGGIRNVNVLDLLRGVSDTELLTGYLPVSSIARTTVQRQPDPVLHRLHTCRLW